MGKFIRYLAMASLLLFCLYSVWFIISKPDTLWDFKCYYYSVRAFNNGYNPYGTSALIAHYGFYLYPFVYIPIALYIFEPFSWLDFKVAAGLYLLIKLLMLGSLLFLWQKYFLNRCNDLWFYLFVLLAFNNSIYIDLSTGNVALVEDFFLWWGFYFWSKCNFKVFCGCILAAGLFKGWPFIFLGLLIFSQSRKKWSYLVASCSVAGLVITGSWLANPVLFAAFLQNASHMDERGNLNPSSLAILRDILQIPPQATISLTFLEVVVYLGIVGIVLIISFIFSKFLIKQRQLPFEQRQILLIFLACLVYGLILPRFKDYSYSLLIPPAYFVWEKLKGLKRATPLIWLIVMLPVADRGLLSLPGVQPGALLNQYHSLVISFFSWVFYLFYLRQIKGPVIKPGDKSFSEADFANIIRY